MSAAADFRKLLMLAQAGEIPDKVPAAGFPHLDLLRRAIRGDMDASLELRSRHAAHDRYLIVVGKDPSSIAVRFTNEKIRGEGRSVPAAFGIAVLMLWGKRNGR